MFRWLSCVVLLATFGTSAYYRWSARTKSEVIPRRREGSRFFVMRALIAFSLVIPAMLYVVYPTWITWSLLPISEWLRWLSLVVGVLTLLGVRWVLHTLGCNVSETVLTKPHHQLITTGPYRWVRHPLYTAGIVLFCSIGLMQGSWLLLMTTGIAASFIRFVVIPAEERALVTKFEDSYQIYRQQTGRLFPRNSVFRRHTTEITANSQKVSR